MEASSSIIHHHRRTTVEESESAMVDNFSEKMKKCQDYMEALEEERRKIQVFHRELPLSLDLINQAIDNCRQQLESSADFEEQTTSSEGPVLEEFIPLKRTSSSDLRQLQKSKEIKVSNNKLDWLKSVQLWNQNPDPVLKEDSPRKTTTVLESKKNGGAFHPFHKAKIPTTQTTTTTTTPPASMATSSTTETVNESGGENQNSNRRGEDQKERERQGVQSSSSLRKTRRCWSPELHRRFLNALQQLGGSHVATPKQIRELMKVDGLTNDEVKSHLQKYRLHTRRPSPTIHNNSNSQPPQFVVVGGIWVPPPEYTTAVAATAGESTQVSCNRVYAPVAAPPHQSSPLFSQQQQQNKKLQQSPTSPLHSDGKSSRADHSLGDDEDEEVHLNSPSISSSTASLAL
ncbi:SANT/Myb domain [Macleaya cordata]|uniref:SANT/Myb domain n=1 Tax=Macleaya cordata TaxID=56857 RepID=A0A200R050_MACCD|nr:SANT/Myb domain [Macleaya cordata]